jgi:gluconolactonase
MGSGQVVRREADGKLTVLADKYEGYHLNAPNDLVIKSNGDHLFHRYPRQHEVDGFLSAGGCGPHRRLSHSRRQAGVAGPHVEAPNGIAFSPDEKVLYVNDIRAKKVLRYDVKADGTLETGKSSSI